MPFVEGESLRQRLQRSGRLPVDDAVALAGEVADALAYAHAHGVVHRDIKPENILLSGGHAVVADFGVAKAIERGAAATATSDDAAAHRASGIAVGTPEYMSPEQATGADVVDARADQYSLGCVLYEMLAGTPPVRRRRARKSVIAQSLTAPRPRVSELPARRAGRARARGARAMAADPAERFPDMAAFARGAPRGARGRRRRRPAWPCCSAALASRLSPRGRRRWLGTARRRHTVAPAAEMLADPAVQRLRARASALLGEGMVDLLSTNL